MDSICGIVDFLKTLAQFSLVYQESLQNWLSEKRVSNTPVTSVSEDVLYNVLTSYTQPVLSSNNIHIDFNALQQLPAEDGNLSQFHSESTAINVGLQLQLMS